MASFGSEAGASADAELLPLVIVPGFCSSCLEVEKSSVSPSWEGKRAWLGLSRLGFQSMHGKGIFDNDADQSLKNKWLQHLVLPSPTQEHDGIRLKAIGGVEGIKSLDPDFCFGLAAEATFVFLPVLRALEGMGYKEGTNLAAASYDWRWAPSILQGRDGYFDRLMQTVESLDRRGTGVVILGHSMGNKTVAYFLQHVKRKPGGAEWLDKHVYSWISAGAPHLGAPAALRCTLLGDKFGLDAFVTESEAIIFARSLSASPWLFPVGAQAEKPMIYLRRGGLLEVKNLSAFVPHCGLSSARNAVQLSVEIVWGEGDQKECLTTKSSTDFEGGTASFDPESNFLRFGGGPPELPANATITVIVKEKGIKDDTKANPLQRLGKGIVAAAQLVDEAMHGRKGMGVPKANTESVALTQLLTGRKHGDGFVDVRLPIASLRRFSLGHSSKDSANDYVTLQVRWLDYRALRQEWLGAQDFLPLPRPSGSTAAAALPPLPVRRRGRKSTAVYDLVNMQQFAKMEAPQVQQVFHDFYEADPTYDHTGVNDCPPIKRVVAVHGINIPTEVMYAMRVNTARLKPTTVQSRFTLDDEAELTAEAPAFLKMEGGKISEIPDAGEACGDGTVPLCSMDHCKDWSGRLDLKVVHLDGSEHRAMLADPRFHLAIREACTPDCPDLEAPVSSGAAVGSRALPPTRYSIAGTWSSWTPSPMEWDGSHFFSLVKITKQGWESFQLLLNGSWETVIYPSVKSANPSVDHRLLGPDNKNKGLDWAIGRPGFNPFGVGRIMPGTEYKVLLEVDDAGRARSVTWDLHLTVQVFAKVEDKAAAKHRWQAAKNASEWWDCPEDVSQQLDAAQAAGLRKVQVRVGRTSYDVDLQRMVQRNRQTGTERAIRVSPS